MRRQLKEESVCYSRDKIKMVLPFEFEYLTKENKLRGVVSSEPGNRVVSGVRGIHYGMDFRMAR